MVKIKFSTNKDMRGRGGRGIFFFSPTSRITFLIRNCVYVLFALFLSKQIKGVGQELKIHIAQTENDVKFQQKKKKKKK